MRRHPRFFYVYMHKYLSRMNSNFPHVTHLNVPTTCHFYSLNAFANKYSTSRLTDLRDLSDLFLIFWIISLSKLKVILCLKLYPPTKV